MNTDKHGFGLERELALISRVDANDLKSAAMLVCLQLFHYPCPSVSIRGFTSLL